jgi:hypothetical protein
MVVIPTISYGLEIAFPNCEKPYVAANDIVKPDAAGTHWKSIPGLGRQRAQLVQTQPHKGQPGVRGVELFFGLRDCELLHASPPK